MPLVNGPRRWERRLRERGVWAARALQFGCPREFRGYFRKLSECASDLGVSEDVLTRFVGATDTPVLTADYVAYGPYRWYVAACRLADAAGTPRPDLASAVRTGASLYGEHTFELGIFDLYVKRNALGLSDREIYLMVQKVSGALGAVAIENERKRRAPDGLHGARQQQFAHRKAARMRAAIDAGELRTVETIFGEIFDLFEREMCSISDELNLSAYPDCDGTIVPDFEAMVALVEHFVARPRPRGPRPKASGLHGVELVREHYGLLTGEHRKTISGDFGEFLKAIFAYFQVAVPGADVGRSRSRRG
jgi:hypothetical protein